MSEPHERRRKSSNITPKLRLVGTPVLSREDTKVEAFVSSDAAGSESNSTLQIDSHLQADTSAIDELPAFERHEESTTIELFYDLFFVANLTAFTSIHEVNTVKTLTSYIGFFCILWFTWCLTSLYDVRFVSDSLLSRAAKGAHLGVMVGLAVVGPKFDTSGHNGQLRILALILMISRLILCFQYLLVAFHVRTYKKATLPLALIAGSSFLAGMIYLGLSFAFEHHKYAYRALYVIAVAEMASNIIISALWKVVSFKGTHLIERMSLLTLYILGEGVIDVLKTVTKISKVQSHWTSANIGTLLGAITALYLLYMLYFDTLNRHHFGSVRQQLWSFLHFPFHAALVLCVTGMAQFVIWQRVMEVFTVLVYALQSQAEQFGTPLGSGTDPVELSRTFIAQIDNDIKAAFSPSTIAENLELSEALINVKGTLLDFGESAAANGVANADVNAVAEALNRISLTALNVVMEFYGFEGQEVDPEATDSPFGAFDAKLNTAILIFKYFFLATGFTIILMGILGLVSVRTYSWGSWFRFATHILVGAATCLLTLLVVGDGEGAYNLTKTAWPLPLIAIIIFIVLAAHHTSWTGKAQENTGKKHYNFLPRWRPNRNGQSSA